jgi:Domain of unknown function (DUF4129)
MQTCRLTTIPIALLGLCCCLQTSLCRATSYVPPGSEETYSAPAEPINIADYPARLRVLHVMLDACARTMTAAACDWKLVGPDAAVRSASKIREGIRKVQFAWLRSALQDASRASSAPVSPKDPGAKQRALEAAQGRLRDAGLRLDQELAQQHGNLKGARDVALERLALKKILASGGYAQEVPPTLFERLRDAFLRWLSRRLNAISESQASQLIVNLLLISLITVVCGAMIWWFARKVQSQRLMLTPPDTPDPSAPSSLDWQKWLDQGKSFAREQQWREAIHHVYWSAISRLESRGFWPADRARTPREYLTLLAARPETLADLRTLTRSFEYTWYGDQIAGQPEFDRACALLERLTR